MGRQMFGWTPDARSMKLCPVVGRMLRWRVWETGLAGIGWVSGPVKVDFSRPIPASPVSRRDLLCIPLIPLANIPAHLFVMNYAWDPF